jgi:hypothetical protein
LVAFGVAEGFGEALGFAFWLDDVPDFLAPLDEPDPEDPPVPDLLVATGLAPSPALPPVVSSPPLVVF